MRSEPNYNTIPVGQLGIVALPGCEELANKIDNYLIRWRFQRNSEHKDTLAFAGYERSTYLINMDFPRFGTGEGKAIAWGCDLTYDYVKINGDYRS